MSAALKSLEEQYAVEVLKPDADEGFLKRLERGIRGLKGIKQPAGQCSVGMHFRIHFRLLFCIVSEQKQCGHSASSSVVWGVAVDFGAYLPAS